MLLIGDAREKMATLEPESVHCVVTSPPYWGLRDYKLPPLVWGGEPGCEHEWAATIEPGGQGSGKSFRRDKKAGRKRGGRQIGFCQLCGAWSGALGLEPTPELYIEHMVDFFRGVWRVLRTDGTLWLNMGDSYAGGKIKEGYTSTGHDLGYSNKQSRKLPPGFKPKDLIGMPWRLALALQADGWWLRSDIIWSKPNPMPESVTDRPASAHEHIFLLTKSARYFYDPVAVREPVAESTANDIRNPEDGNRNNRGYPGAPSRGGTNLTKKLMGTHAGRNQRNVWTIATQPFTGWTRTSHLVRVERDAASDGMMHIVFPNCPEHGDLFDSVAKQFYDGHGAASQNHTEHNDSRPSQEQQGDSAISEKPLGECPESDNLDFSRPPCSPVAIDHNTESHKKDLDPGTSPSCKPFYEILCCTDDRQELLESFVQHVSNDGNNILPDEMAAHLQGRIPHRIVDKSSSFTSNCNCLIYNKSTKKTSHFATFPEEIPRRAILAGTSAKGCCPSCGTPWERVADVTYESSDGTNRKLRTGSHDERAASMRGYVESRGTGLRKITNTTGWRPTCDHPGDPVPCTVLDPFAGSGTVGKVATELGRDYVLIELSEQYAELIKERTQTTLGLGL